MGGNKKNRRGAVAGGIIVTAFLGAIVMFAILLYTEKKVLGKDDTKLVACAVKVIPEGEKITADNVNEYICFREIAEAYIPKGTISEANLFNNISAKYSIAEGSILTETMFRPADIGISRMGNPVLVGIKTEDMYQAAGGILRRGDRVHIYVMNEMDEIELRWSNLYIDEAFDASGNVIDSESSGKATRFNLFIEKDDVEEFYGCIDSQRVRIVRAN